MLDKVQVIKQEQLDKGWSFDVKVEDQMFKVQVDRDYWIQLTLEQYPPAQLVKKSFDFLLARESKEQIMKIFNLHAIQQFFPDYENTIKVK